MSTGDDHRRHHKGEEKKMTVILWNSGKNVIQVKIPDDDDYKATVHAAEKVHTKLKYGHDYSIILKKGNTPKRVTYTPDTEQYEIDIDQYFT